MILLTDYEVTGKREYISVSCNPATKSAGRLKVRVLQQLIEGRGLMETIRKREPTSQNFMASWNIGREPIGWVLGMLFDGSVIAGPTFV
jgi:hypothetical protein